VRASDAHAVARPGDGFAPARQPAATAVDQLPPHSPERLRADRIAGRPSVAGAGSMSGRIIALLSGCDRRDRSRSFAGHIHWPANYLFLLVFPWRVTDVTDVTGSFHSAMR
jgi:hypothetical protein